MGQSTSTLIENEGHEVHLPSQLIRSTWHCTSVWGSVEVTWRSIFGTRSRGYLTQPVPSGATNASFPVQSRESLGQRGLHPATLPGSRRCTGATSPMASRFSRTNRASALTTDAPRTALTLIRYTWLASFMTIITGSPVTACLKVVDLVMLATPHRYGSVVLSARQLWQPLDDHLYPCIAQSPACIIWCHPYNAYTHP